MLADIRRTRLDKMSFPQITETYVNGTSGYIIWSNKFCIQWGRTTANGTITLLKSFIDTNYSVDGTPIGTNGRGYAIRAYDLTKTSFALGGGYATNTGVSTTTHGFSWEAKGYIS
ncbi:MAG: hypothetical protein J6Q89_05565 [Clostridia bacterium]|nr:hypothetical protein [Clostridia bacterium]